MGNGKNPGAVMEMKKTIIPFGEKILVKRRRVGDRLGKERIIYASEHTASAPTDLATIIYVPDLTFGDKAILDNAEQIIKEMANKAKSGDSDALVALLKLNEFIMHKSLKVGDLIMLSKYVGITFTEDDPTEELTLVNTNDVIGLVREI